MDGMMRAVAIETATDGITINGVAPGWIATASSTESEKISALHTPLGRAGSPDEVAAAVASSPRPKLPTSLDKSWSSTAATFCRRTRRLEAQAPNLIDAESRRPQ